MKHYFKNPRQITEKDFVSLSAWLEEFGDLSGIVHNIETDEIIGGNQRAEAMHLFEAIPVIIQVFNPPTKQGTIALGYFEWEGERYNYRRVKWDEHKAEQANIIANKAGGHWDFDILANQFDFQDLLDWGFMERELLGHGISFPTQEDENRVESFSSQEKLMILIECSSEREQMELLNEFKERNMNCRTFNANKNEA